MRLPHIILTAAFAGLAITPSHAVLGLFEDKPRVAEAPTDAELAKQEVAARQLFEKAKEVEKKGRVKKAEEILDELVRLYPLTKMAATAQFSIARIEEREGNLFTAFDEYQEFVDHYKGSELFGEAIRSQFEIATKAMNQKVARVLLIPAKAQPSKVIEMFETVAANAPYSKYAPLAVYNIGLLQENAGQSDEAIAAYQRVAEDYPDDPKAAEARSQIIAIRQQKTRNTRDDGTLQKVQEDMLDFISQNPEDPRAEEYQAQLGKYEDRDAEKDFNIGRYYEQKDNLRAAAIYYRSIRPGMARYDDAQARLADIKAQDPNLVLPPKAQKKKVQAQTNTVDRPDYYGPKPPALEGPAKPKMRTSDPELLPIESPAADESASDTSASVE